MSALNLQSDILGPKSAGYYQCHSVLFPPNYTPTFSSNEVTSLQVTLNFTIHQFTEIHLILFSGLTVFH